MNFVTIDFETANSELNSACSIGIVVVEKGIMVKKYYRLIKPVNGIFLKENIAIHGITPQMVKAEPSFQELWPEIKNILANKLVFAHNASFDTRVLKNSLACKPLDIEIRYACTVLLSRRIWQNLPNHKLGTMSNYLKIEFEHHNALEDASACAQIVLAAAALTQSRNILELIKSTKLPIKQLA